MATHQMTDKEIKSDILATLGFVAMERVEAGSFKLIGAPPSWFVEFYPQAAEGASLRPQETFLFLDYFLSEADSFWESRDPGPLRSGVWTEACAATKQYNLEASALRLGERRLLVIEPLRSAYGDLQALTQKAREQSLDYEHAGKRLGATSEQLRALTAKLSSAREEEGIRIAREIHDELGSALTSLRWDLESFDKTISESGDRPQLRQRIAAMIGLTDTTISAVRRIASELRPSVLDDLGLAEAIEWEAQQFQARTGITCQCDCCLENLDLSQEQSTAVFRIVQETLTNILRHAQAARVDITMEEKAGEFVLNISDNGKGITENQKSAPQSLGLLGMRERANLIGGEINITGVEGKGTVVTVRVPTSG